MRFYPEEEKNDKAFAKKLAAPFDLYVNDAFGTPLWLTINISPSTALGREDNPAVPAALSLSRRRGTGAGARYLSCLKVA